MSWESDDKADPNIETRAARATALAEWKIDAARRARAEAAHQTAMGRCCYQKKSDGSCRIHS